MYDAFIVSRVNGVSIGGGTYGNNYGGFLDFTNDGSTTGLTGTQTQYILVGTQQTGLTLGGSLGYIPLSNHTVFNIQSKISTFDPNKLTNNNRDVLVSTGSTNFVDGLIDGNNIYLDALGFTPTINGTQPFTQLSISVGTAELSGNILTNYCQTRSLNNDAILLNGGNYKTFWGPWQWNPTDNAFWSADTIQAIKNQTPRGCCNSIVVTQTPTITETPPVTPTNTETPPVTPTNTETPTETPPVTPTNTETPTETPPITPTITETPMLIRNCTSPRLGGTDAPNPPLIIYLDLATVPDGNTVTLVIEVQQGNPGTISTIVTDINTNSIIGSKTFAGTGTGCSPGATYCADTLSFVKPAGQQSVKITISGTATLWGFSTIC
jgi:hypothetical protein